MDCSWLKISQSLQKGFTIINQLDEIKYEHFVHRIVGKMKRLDSEIFTLEERLKLQKIFKIDDESLTLAIKTILYLFRRMLKFIFMPVNLKNDLVQVGLSNEKAECIVKVWSGETKSTLDDLGSENVDKSGDSSNFSWKLNAELSSDLRKKCKVPKAYILFEGQKEETELELTHPELYSLFLQFESIQNELDNVM